MLNPDNIPPEIGWPVAALLWLLLFVMILRDTLRVNKLIKQRDEEQKHIQESLDDTQTRYRIDENGIPLYDRDRDRIFSWDADKPKTRREARSRKPVSNFYDQEQDNVG